MSAEVQLPRNQDNRSLYTWAQGIVDYLRRNVITVTERITTIVTERIQPIEDDRADALTASAAYADDVQAAITAANGYAQGVYNEYQTAATALQSATAQWYLTQAANMVEQQTRISEDSVLSSRIDTVQASLATTNAAVSTEVTARVDGDTALGFRIDTVQSQANGNTAAVQSVTSSVNGIKAQWGVAISLNNQVTGLVRLDSGASGSNFVVVADRFIVSHPSAAGTLITPFVVGLVNGVSTVGISGNLVVDGSILGRHIEAGAVTATKIAANSIDATKIVSASITTDKLAAKVVTVDKIDVSAIDGISANLGLIKAGRMQSADGKMIIDLDAKSITMAV